MRMRKVTKEITLNELLDKFLLVKEAQGTGQAAMNDYRNCIKRFICSSGGIDTLNEDVLRFFSSIPNTSPARYNKPYQNLNAFFNWMVDQKYIEANPIKINRLSKKKDDGNIKPIDLDKLQKYINTLDKETYIGLRNYVVIMIMLDTGIRTSELLGLHERDYDILNKNLTIDKNIAKTRKKRIVYLSPKTAKILEDFLDIKPDEWEDWLIPNYEGHQLKVTYLDKSFAKHSEVCGVKITPYQLRHSFATLFLKCGGDLFTLQHLMGHSDLRMTKRYTELDEEFINSQHQTYSPVKLINQKKVRIR